jgi:hypothetical protein
MQITAIVIVAATLLLALFSRMALNFSLLSPRHSRTMAESSGNAVVDNAAKDSYFPMHIAPMRRKDGEQGARRRERATARPK